MNDIFISFDENRNFFKKLYSYFESGSQSNEDNPPEWVLGNLHIWTLHHCGAHQEPEEWAQTLGPNLGNEPGPSVQALHGCSPYLQVGECKYDMNGTAKNRSPLECSVLWRHHNMPGYQSSLGKVEQLCNHVSPHLLIDTITQQYNKYCAKYLFSQCRWIVWKVSELKTSNKRS